jgi:hypothetical protein
MLVQFDRLVDPTKKLLLPLKGNESLFPKSLVEAQASGTKVSDDVAESVFKRLAAASP